MKLSKVVVPDLAEPIIMAFGNFRVSLLLSVLFVLTSNDSDAFESEGF